MATAAGGPAYECASAIRISSSLLPGGYVTGIFEFTPATPYIVGYSWNGIASLNEYITATGGSSTTTAEEIVSNPSNDNQTLNGFMNLNYLATGTSCG